MYGLGLMTIPVAWTFPAATVFYWVINNSFSLGQTAFLNFPGVKDKLGIALVVVFVGSIIGYVVVTFL